MHLYYRCEQISVGYDQQSFVGNQTHYVFLQRCSCDYMFYPGRNVLFWAPNSLLRPQKHGKIFTVYGKSVLISGTLYNKNNYVNACVMTGKYHCSILVHLGLLHPARFICLIGSILPYYTNIQIHCLLSSIVLQYMNVCPRW